MKIIKYNDYKEMAVAFQCLEVARLNEVLKRNGIESKSLRQRICAEYIFENAAFLDAGSFESDGKKVYPEVHFSERQYDREHGLSEPLKLYMPRNYVSFHEYAHDCIYWYFTENNEDASEIKQFEL